MLCVPKTSGASAAANEDVSWLWNGPFGYGTFYVAAKPTTAALLQKAAADLGVDFTGVAASPADPAAAIRPVRIGLWDRYGGSVESGWIRWLLERYEFPCDVVYPQTLDAGDLHARYDVLIFPTDAIPSRDAGAPAVPPDLPAEYAGRTGVVTVGRTIPQLRAFVEQGGRLLAIGSSTSVAQHFGLPVTSALLTKAADGSTQQIPRSRFYVPGSILRVAVDNASPLAFGLGRDADVFFDDSPAFVLDANAAAAGVTRVAWYDSDAPLRSGWAWGQSLLKGSAAIVDAPLGKGRVILYGPEITFRAQPHGTFKFLFNGIDYGSSALPSSQALAPSHSN